MREPGATSGARAAVVVLQLHLTCGACGREWTLADNGTDVVRIRELWSCVLVEYDRCPACAHGGVELHEKFVELPDEECAGPAVPLNCRGGDDRAESHTTREEVTS